MKDCDANDDADKERHDYMAGPERQDQCGNWRKQSDDPRNTIRRVLHNDRVTARCIHLDWNHELPELCDHNKRVIHGCFNWIDLSKDCAGGFRRRYVGKFHQDGKIVVGHADHIIAVRFRVRSVNSIDGNTLICAYYRYQCDREKYETHWRKSRTAAMLLLGVSQWFRYQIFAPYNF